MNIKSANELVNEALKEIKRISAEEALEKIKFYVREDATFNIIGEDSVSLCLKLGIIVESGVMRVDSVPFALVLA